jgi:hypothetical protein
VRSLGAEERSDGLPARALGTALQTCAAPRIRFGEHHQVLGAHRPANEGPEQCNGRVVKAVGAGKRRLGGHRRGRGEGPDDRGAALRRIGRDRTGNGALTRSLEGGQPRFGGEPRSRGVRARLLCGPEQPGGMEVLSSGEEALSAGGDERVLEVEERSREVVEWCTRRSIGDMMSISPASRCVSKRGQEIGNRGTPGSRSHIGGRTHRHPSGNNSASRCAAHACSARVGSVHSDVCSRAGQSPLPLGDSGVLLEHARQVPGRTPVQRACICDRKGGCLSHLSDFPLEFLPSARSPSSVALSIPSTKSS